MSMPFEKFENIMNTIIEFDKKRNRISDFIEKEISTSTYCVVDVGSEVETTLINLLADEFNCWYGKESKEDGSCNWWTYNKGYGLENDIEYWLYSFIMDEDNKCLYDKDGNEIKVNTLKDFYNYLCSCKDK